MTERPGVSQAGIHVVAGGFPSSRFPSVELARRLAVAGHRVTWCGPREAEDLVRGRGLEFRALESRGLGAFREVDGRRGLFRRILEVGERRSRALESMALGGFERKLRTDRPELVLIDAEMHEHVLVALGVGVRVALLNFFVSIWRRPGLPPPHTAVRPGVGPRGSPLGIRLLWAVATGRKRWRARWQTLRQVGCDRLSLLRRLAREAGVDLESETDDRQWPIPFAYRRLPVLTLHAEELELPHRSPPNAVHVGPMVLEDRPEPPLSSTDRARLRRILERRRDGDGERRLVYAGFGSTLTARPDLLRALGGVVSERPGRELVISLAGRRSPAELGPLPEGVHAFPRVPQLRVLEMADAAILHGGANTVDECVLAGVPMLVYCGFETDMGGNTARIVHHGLGVAGGRRDRPETIRGRVDRLLGDPEVRRRVGRMGEALRAYADGEVLERAVDRILAGAPLGRDGSQAGPRAREAER